MKNKKIFILIFFILLVFCVTCMKAIYKDNNIKNESEVEGEISFLSNRVDKKEELDKLIEEFEKKYPKTKINLELIGDLGEILQRKANVQELSDVTIIPSSIGNNKYYKYFLPIDNLGFSEKNIYNYSLGLGEDKKLYGLTTSVTWNGIIYNKNIFKEAKIDEIPKTKKEFFEDCKKIKDLGFIPFTINYKQSWCVEQWLDTISFNFEPDMITNLMDTEKDIFNNSGLGKSLDFVREIYVNGYSEEDLINYEWQQCKNDFVNGKVAMLLCGSDFKYQIQDLGMNIDDIGMFPVPETEEIKIHGDYKLGIAKNTEYPNLAKTFLKFLFEDGRYAKAVNIISPMKDNKETIKFFDEINNFSQEKVIQGDIEKEQKEEDLKKYQDFDNLRKKTRLDYSFVQEYITSDHIETLKNDMNKKWSEGRKNIQK